MKYKFAGQRKGEDQMTKNELGEHIISWQDHLYRVAKTLLYNDADCSDAIQNAIVKAFTNIATLKNDKYAKTWMIRILINECYSIMRKENKLVSLESIPEQDYEQKDYSDLYEALMTLPEDQRMAVALYYSEGFSVKEIAEIENTTDSAIKNRLFKARGKLKNLLEGKERCLYEVKKSEA